MRTSHALTWLVTLIVVLALLATCSGLFWRGGGDPETFTTQRGQTALLYGQGLYRYDTFLVATGNKGTDAVTLVFEIPLLVVALVLYRRGSLRGALLMLGSLGWFLYYYLSMTFATAYNSLFPVYLALFSTSFFAFIVAFTSIDMASLPAYFGDRLPCRSIVVYLFAVGMLLSLVWLGLTLLPAILTGTPPATMASYTSPVTAALDLAIITPVAFLAGVQYRRRTPLGYLLACMLILVNVTLGTALLGQGTAQLLLGAPLSPGEIISFMVSFAILTLVSIWLAVVLLRGLSAPTPSRSGSSRERNPRPA